MRRLFSFFCAIFLLGACSEYIEIPLDSGVDTLIINARLESHNEYHYIYLSKKQGSKIIAPENAEVNITINGSSSTQLERDEQINAFLAYPFHYLFKPGDRVEIVAKSGELRAKVQVVFPKAVDTVKVEQASALEEGKSVKTQISFKDDSLQSDYYRLTCTNYYRVRGTKVKSGESEEFDYIGYPSFSTSSVLINGPLSDNDTMLGGLFNTLNPDNDTKVFDDELVSGQDVSIDMQVKLKENYNSVGYKSVDLTDRRIDIHLQHLSPEAYHYLRVINAGSNLSFAATILAEPTVLPSNVEGGKGFVMALTSTSDSIVLPDVYDIPIEQIPYTQ